MRRREFIAAIAGAASWNPAHGQPQRQPPLIGFLSSASPAEWQGRTRAFLDGLAEAGFVEGKDFSIEWRWAEGRNARLPVLARDLVDREVAAIAVLGNTQSALAARDATSTIPIVFRVAANPVETGLVSSLSRPGANLTGVNTLGAEVGPKHVELLHELLPAARDFALLVNPTNPPLAAVQSRDIPEAATRLGIRLRILHASNGSELEAVLAMAEPLVIGADAFFNSRGERLAALALRNRIPTISPYREFTEAGGLLSYGGSIAEGSRRAGVYMARILRGARPAELPVEQVVKLDLVLNMATAKSLGLDVPSHMQQRADAIIE
jgi:putative ABC transport system substrate-binding protein